MLFEKRFWPLIADGSVTVTFRRWRRRQVVPGRRYRTAAGLIEVETLDVVDPAGISDADARRAGYGSPPELVADLRRDDSLPVYRIAFHAVHTPDPRDVLAASDGLSDEDVAEIDKRLARLDRTKGPWTLDTLRLIAARPATRAADLAASVGRERADFKLDVRKLKNLGLTISLERGYRLSPRGAAYLACRERRSRAEH